MFFRLDNTQVSFPDPRLGEPDGLLAIGGDLSIDRLLLAYSNGIFPWYRSATATNRYGIARWNGSSSFPKRFMCRIQCAR